MPTIAREPVQTSSASSEWRWTGDAWDRRSTVRLELNYSVKLRRPGVPRDIDALTRNVSYSGFYFQSNAPFRLNDRVEYEMIMPWNASADSTAHSGPPVEMVLRGAARVVRVDASRSGTLSGIACRMEGEYRISRRDEEGSSLIETLPVTAEAC